MRFRLLLFIGLVLPSFALANQVALVIGHTEYKEVAILPNAKNDAREISAALQKQGFEVYSAIDLTRNQLFSALRKFRDRADRSEVALVYYAGHGIEIAGKNYLVPIDARLREERDADVELVPVETVLSQISGAGSLKMVVLDACRDNPFAVKMRRLSRGRNVGSGLGKIDVADADTLIAYAAAAGEVTPDGEEGGNSPFTAAFLKALDGPPRDVRRLLGAVRDEMRRTVPGAAPFVYTSLGGNEFVINPKGRRKAAASSSATSVSTPLHGIFSDFADAERSANTEKWRSFLDKYKTENDNPLLALAHEKLKELDMMAPSSVKPMKEREIQGIRAAYIQASESGTIEAWMSFLAKYDNLPDNAYTKLATKALAAIEATPEALSPSALPPPSIGKDYNRAKATNTLGEWRWFHEKYKNWPHNGLVAIAKEQIALVEQEELRPEGQEIQIMRDFREASQEDTIRGWHHFMRKYSNRTDHALMEQAKERRVRVTKERESTENSLDLTPQQVQHIRYVLTDMYAKTDFYKRRTLHISTWTRYWVGEYSEKEFGVFRQYLDEKTAQQLLRVKFTPHEYRYWKNTEKHQDWESFVNESEGSCTITSFALPTDGEVFYTKPRMSFSALKTAKKDLMRLSLVDPIPFDRLKPIFVLANGRRMKTHIDDGDLKPRKTGENQVSIEVTQALRRSQYIDIIGTSDFSGQELRLRFSAMGFSAAFEQMVKDCGRPALRGWVR